MFPEHRELIAALRQSDKHFRRLFDQHSSLDHRIRNIENSLIPGDHFMIESLKKEKLRLKDDLYTILKQNGTN